MLTSRTRKPIQVAAVFTLTLIVYWLCASEPRISSNVGKTRSLGNQERVSNADKVSRQANSKAQPFSALELDTGEEIKPDLEGSTIPESSGGQIVNASPSLNPISSTSGSLKHGSGSENVKEEDRDFPVSSIEGLGARTGQRANRIIVSGESSELQLLPSATPSLKPWVTGSARGFVMLALMHPKARPSVEKTIEAMLDSHLKNLFLATLVDGSFGFDLDYLLSVIERLNLEGRSLTLALYLSNGPSMRRFNSGTFISGFNQIEPGEFRRLIRFDPRTRQKFQTLVSKIRAAFELNQALNENNLNLVIPMLEDNLDVASYEAMRGLAADRLRGINIQFVRNPCPRCYDGNDSNPRGALLESHELKQIADGNDMQGVTLDGTGYHYPFEVPSGNSLSISQLHSVLDQSVQRKLLYVGLWRADRQGIYSNVLLNPDLRDYAIPTAESQALDIEILRYGLSETTDSAAPR